MSLDTSASPGARFGRYRIYEQLGEGGMGTVHRAVVEGARGFTKPVVIKRILRELSGNSEFAEMLIQEAKLCALLRHPSIVQVQDFGEVDGELFLAMEIIEGLDLVTVLRICKQTRIAVPPAIVCYIVAELASALAYAHALTDEHGASLHIVHRDVSPSNIMLTHHGGVKLLDFGIAKAVGTLRDERTKSGAVRGKVGYMSPEQVDARPIDGRSDLFALGVVAWECLTARRLFGSSSDLLTLRMIREANVPVPSSLAGELSPEIDAVVLKLLARDPDMRFARGDDVAAALAPIVHRANANTATLRAFVGSLDPAVAGRPIEPSVTELTTLAAANSDLRPPTVRQREPSRRRTVVLAAGAAVTIGIGAAAILALTSHRAAPIERAADPLSTQVAAMPTPSADAAVDSDAAVDTSPRAELVTLHVDGTRAAEVVLDGVSIGHVPLEVEVPRQAGQRRLIVRLAGRAPLITRVPADQSVSVTADLRHRPRTQATRPRRETSSTTSDQPGVIIKDPFAPRPN